MQRRRAHQLRVQRPGELRLRAHRAHAAVGGIGVVELLLQRAHQAAPVGPERRHRLLLAPAQRGDVGVAVAVVLPRHAGLTGPARAVAGDRALHVEHLQHRLDPPLAEVDDAHQLVGGRAAVLQRFEHRVDALLRRERLLDEEVLDPAVLGAAQQHHVGAVDRAPRAADLLVVGDDRSGRLVVHDEAEVGLVVAHAQRARRDHALELVAEQLLLGRDPRRGVHLAAVGLRGHPVGVQEIGD